MIRTALALIAVGLVQLTGSPVAGQEVFRSAYHDFRVVTVADGLVNPWSMTWLPGGDMLITERPGRLRIVRRGTLLADPVAGVPEVFAQGQGGLFDVLPHPDFASNRLLCLSYARPKGEGSTTAVVRGRFENDRLTDIEDIFEARPKAADTTVAGLPGTTTGSCSSLSVSDRCRPLETSRHTRRRISRTTMA